MKPTITITRYSRESLTDRFCSRRNARLTARCRRLTDSLPVGRVRIDSTAEPNQSASSMLAALRTCSSGSRNARCLSRLFSAAQRTGREDSTARRRTSHRSLYMASRITFSPSGTFSTSQAGTGRSRLSRLMQSRYASWPETPISSR